VIGCYVAWRNGHLTDASRRKVIKRGTTIKRARCMALY
jgi:hypothetical protein